MAELGAIREAIAANANAIADWQFSPWMLSNPTPPCGHVIPGFASELIEFDQTLQRGLDRLLFTVQVFVSEAGGDQGAQVNLDKYLAGSGPSSLKEAIEQADDNGNVTLGGLCEDLRVTGTTGYRRFTFEGRPTLLGAEWRVEVYTSGD